MNIAIVYKKKSKVKIIGKFNDIDLVAVGIEVLKDFINRESQKKKVEKSEISKKIKELLD